MKPLLGGLLTIACAGGLPFTCCGPAAKHGEMPMQPGAVCCAAEAESIAIQQLKMRGFDTAAHSPYHVILTGDVWVVTGTADPKADVTPIVRLDRRSGAIQEAEWTEITK